MSPNKKQINKIVEDTFEEFYYMLETHRTWDYVETVKCHIDLKLENIIKDETQNK